VIVVYQSGAGEAISNWADCEFSI